MHGHVNVKLDKLIHVRDCELLPQRNVPNIVPNFKSQIEETIKQKKVENGVGVI